MHLRLLNCKLDLTYVVQVLGPEITPPLLNRLSSPAFKVLASQLLARCQSTIGRIQRESSSYDATAQGRDFRRRLGTILREEGPAALYKGFVPKVLRLAPGGGVLLLVVEFTLDMFRKGKCPLTPIVSGYIYSYLQLWDLRIFNMDIHEGSPTMLSESP